MDYEKEEEEYVPLNWNALMKDPDVLEEIKMYLDELEAEYLLRIITKAKEKNMKDKDIFLPVTKVEYVDVSKSDPFEDTTED